MSGFAVQVSRQNELSIEKDKITYNGKVAGVRLSQRSNRPSFVRYKAGASLNLFILLLMAILAQALFAFVRCNLMSFSLLSARHNLSPLKMKK